MPRHQSDRRSSVAAVLAAPIAHLAAAVLRTQGGIAVVESPALGAAPPAPGATPAGLTLLVAPEDEAKAAEILRERGLI